MQKISPRPAFVLLTCLLLFARIAEAQVCTSSSIGFTAGSATINATLNCVGFLACHPPELDGPQYSTDGCDPEQGSCSVRGLVPSRFPGNHNNNSGIAPDSPVKLLWTNSGGGVVGSCGNFGARIQKDDGEAWIRVTNFSCADPAATQGGDTYTLKAIVCEGAAGCTQERTQMVDMTPKTLAAILCEPPPPPDNCAKNPDCRTCVGGGGPGGPGASSGGGGPGAGPAGSGPGAHLTYRAGSVGNPIFPEPPGWTDLLGRYWSHDYAERIVVDPDDSKVWLITRDATYRKFTDPDAGGVYQTVSPSDEYRTLTKTIEGWELRDLDGTVDRYASDGRWLERVDKNGNVRTATYDPTTFRLASVSFPDGRGETFGYLAGSGKLATITEIGVDGTTNRAWTYTWNGFDLGQIDRPDGTAWRFVYGDVFHPGFMTRMILIGTDGAERIERAWQYDVSGNVVQTWKGADNPLDPNAVERWTLAFDDPSRPAETTITDPLGNPSVVLLGRDPSSRKPRLEGLADSCPSCGLDPNSTLIYDDPAHPLRPTSEIDGDGTVTIMTWDADGQLISRIEDLNGLLERETSLSYDALFPAFVNEIRRPSVTGNPLDERITTLTINASGDQTNRVETGFEEGFAFSHETVTTWTAEGMTATIDPPGFAAADVTTFTYDPARGNLFVQTRTDPVIGTTSFEYDAFNRTTAVIDPNGARVETLYDDLDRVTTTIQRGETPAEDLVTVNVYNVFGDLFQTILPEGNVIEYGYDSAGRLVSIERKPDALPESHGERTVYTLDGLGHQVREEHQRWDNNGMAWIPESVNEFIYSTRCYLDQVIEGAGSANESITEYGYNCDGDLDRLWDANHPSNSRTAPPSTTYLYDALDRLTAVEQPWTGAGGGSAVSEFGYDVQDHLIQVLDAEGNVTTTTYSDRDLLTEEVSEVTGTTTHTYNDHGELSETLDARSVLAVRSYDALDRILGVDYPGDAQDIAYTYDDPLVPFSLGRLTSIARDGHAVDYRYDIFGRTVQDGSIGYTYDRNGNQTEITYPSGATATYTYDYADRQATLDVLEPGQAGRPIVTNASYYASGPLRALSFGNGVNESRLHDTRYHPDRITVTGPSGTLLDWEYTTDGVGNPTLIEDLLNSANHRTYGYQDYQYFLTLGNGPWGDQSWTYDKIGNRLTETRDGVVDTYSYPTNGAGGNNPMLASITLGAGGSQSFGYDAMGNQTGITTAAGAEAWEYDAAGRLATIRPPNSEVEVVFEYDGRSYLRRAAQVTPEAIFADGFEKGDAQCWSAVVGGSGAVGISCLPLSLTEALYSTTGEILSTSNQGGETIQNYFYFAANAVAVSTINDTITVHYISRDHLGSPMATTDQAVSNTWLGALQPFGNEIPGNLLPGSISLRLPGQWENTSWAEISENALYYNLHRWYSPDQGAYNRPDPLSTGNAPPHSTPFAYASANPLYFTDPDGLQAMGGVFLGGSRSKSFLKCFFCLLAKSNFSTQCTEQGAWITKGKGGSAGCSLWPPSGELERMTFRGKVPPPGELLGQAHTHPTRCPKARANGPRPSPTDKGLAELKNIPVCTISTSGIWCYNPKTKKNVQIGSSNWWKSLKQSGCDPCNGIN